MPTVLLLHHYYILFNAHFYQKHYIELNQLFKPYGITYKDPCFNFASKYKPEQIRKYLFNIFHDVNLNSLPKNFTKILRRKLVNSFTRGMRNCLKNYLVFTITLCYDDYSERW